MSSDDSTSALTREVEEFTRKVAAATQLTRSGFAIEAKRCYDIAFFQDRAVSGKITSITQRALALYNHLDALLERVRPLIRNNFKPVAQIAWRYSPSDLLLAFVLDAPHFITACENVHQDWLGGMCDYCGRPNAAADFRDRFRLAFEEEWKHLIWEAELEAAPAAADTSGRSQAEISSRMQPELVPTPPIPAQDSTPDVSPNPKPADWRIEKGREVYELYEELKRIRNYARSGKKGGKSEETLRRDHGEFTIWRKIDECATLEKETRGSFFALLPRAYADDLYEFIGRLFNTGAVNAKLWRVLYRKALPRSKRRKRLSKKTTMDDHAA